MGRPAKDLTKKQFGLLTVLEKAGKAPDGHILWKCQCQCQNKTIVYKTSNVLQRKNSFPSCGCIVNELISQARKNRAENLIGQRFGKLIPKEKMNIDKPGVWWRCQCDCGNNSFITTTHHLKSGNTKSCGCLKSIGEYNIQQLLIKNKIPFIKEKIFNDFKYKNSIGMPRFDFYLTDNNRLIEFDGSQHYNKTNLNWEENINLEERQKRDKEKNQYALDHNIPLVRIPYWERDNITLDMILGDRYLVTK